MKLRATVEQYIPGVQFVICFFELATHFLVPLPPPAMPFKKQYLI